LTFSYVNGAWQQLCALCRVPEPFAGREDSLERRILSLDALLHPMEQLESAMAEVRTEDWQQKRRRYKDHPKPPFAAELSMS
jgi:hypothetical protein